MASRRLALIALAGVIGLTLTACGGGSDTSSADDSGSPTTAPPASSKAASDKFTITAKANSTNTGFTAQSSSAPAKTPLTILFVNDDPGIPHNVVIFKGSKATGTPVFAPTGKDELITGPAKSTYQVPALAAGTYTYNCSVHPTTMVGTLKVA